MSVLTTNKILVMIYYFTLFAYSVEQLIIVYFIAARTTSQRRRASGQVHASRRHLARRHSVTGRERASRQEWSRAWRVLAAGMSLSSVMCNFHYEITFQL